MNSNILIETKRLLRTDKRSLQELSRQSKIPFSTLRYIKIGSTRFPRFDTLIALHTFLTAKRNGKK